MLHQARLAITGLSPPTATVARPVKWLHSRSPMPAGQRTCLFGGRGEPARGHQNRRLVGLAFNGTIAIASTINITNNVFLDGRASRLVSAAAMQCGVLHCAGRNILRHQSDVGHGSCLVTNGTPGNACRCRGDLQRWWNSDFGRVQVEE